MLDYGDVMLDLDRLQTIIRDNHLPAEIKDSGQTWVQVELTDQRMGLAKTLTMGRSDFVDLILHWHQHGCHIHPCPAMSASVSDEAHQ